MERLRNSIIKESCLLKSPASKLTNFDSRKAKIKRISRFALENRGGQIDVEYELAEKIKNMVTRLAAFLKQKELKKHLKIIFTQGRVVLELILYACKIQLEYMVIDEVNAQVMVVAITTGGTAGFVVSWFKAGALIITFPVIASVFLMRSFVQQIMHQVKFSKLQNMLSKLLNDKEIQDTITIQTILIDTGKQIDNSKKITIESLNWNTNPKIKEAAERLGIFKNSPHVTGKLHLDPSDPKSTTILEELGIIKNPIGGIMQEEVTAKVKEKVKGKTIYFRDFIDRMVDDGDMLDPGIIDTEIIEKPIWIRIRD